MAEHSFPAQAKKIYRITFLLSILIFLNILFGPLVRATDSGLGCPDWPLCYGKVVPPPKLTAYMEVGHRFYSGIISLLFAYILFFIFSHKILRNKFGIMAGLSFLALISQIILGALTVTRLLDPTTVNLHLLNAVLFFFFLVNLSLKAKDEVEGIKGPNKNRLFLPFNSGLLLTVFSVYLQLFMGGRVSSNYAGLVCYEWPTCNNGLWFPSFAGPVGFHVQHRLMAYFILLLIFLLFAFAKKNKTSFSNQSLKYLNFAVLIVVLQVILGILNVILRLPILLTALHSGLGVLLFIMVYIALYHNLKEQQS